MSRIRRLAGIAMTMLGLGLGLGLAVASPAVASTATIPLPPGGPPQSPPRIVAVGGMPGWQITLIAVAAAVVAALGAVLVDRARAGAPSSRLPQLTRR
jgi:hypothetical protein